MPTAFFDELIDLLQALWATPNRWLRRLIVLAIATPFLSMLAGMFWGPLAMMTALVPVIIVVRWVTLVVDPLVIGIINQYDFGKKLTGWVVLVCGVELSWAFFCGIFPLENDLRVSFTALFALLAAAALAGGSAYLKLEFGWPRRLAKLLVFAALVCGIILLLVGDNKPKKENSIPKRIIGNVLEMKAEAADILSIFGNNQAESGTRMAPSLTPNLNVCAGAQDITIDYNGSGAEVPLDPVCWSGWIRTPPSADLSIRNGDLAMEMFFIQGETWNVGGSPKYIGQVPSSTFRLRGEGGKAIIFLSPALNK